MANEILYVDNSLLSAIARCSTEAHLRHVLGFTTLEEQATLRAGTAYHEALASWFTVGKIDDAMGAFATSYQDWAEANVSEDDRLSWTNTSRIVRYWLETHPPQALPFTVRPDLVEVGFAHPLTDDGSIMFCGRLDAVATYTEAVYLVEHKAQPLTARVLTPQGFVPMGSLTVGSLIIGVDGRPYHVTEVLPQGKQEAFRVRLTDGGETTCSREHLWTVTDQYKLRGGTLTLGEMLNAPSYLRWHLPRLAPVRFTRGERLPLDGYLLGVLLGDGYLAGHSVQLSARGLTQVTLIRDLLPEGDQIKKQRGGNNTWTISGGRTLASIRALGLAGTHAWTKFIPVSYLYAPVPTRLAVLQGLLDTDGNVFEGHVSYTTTSERLALEVVELVRSLGGVARSGKRSSTKHQAYVVRLQLPTFMPFRLPRKRRGVRQLRRPGVRIIDSIEAIGPTEMQCLRVSAPGGLYVTDDYLVTHNSTGRITQTWLRKWRLDSQPTGYIWGARQHLGEPVVGVILNAIEFSKLPMSDRNCTRHAVPYAECGHLHGNAEMIVVTRTEEQLVEWRKTAIHLATRYRDLLTRFPALTDAHRVRMQGTFNGSCGWCAFNDYCAIGRPASYVSANLVHNPWKPYDFAAAHTAHKP